jgi:hypothetical protein
MVARDQLCDRTAHRVADYDRRGDLELAQRGGGIAGAVREPERLERAKSAPVAAVIDRQHAVARVDQGLVAAAPVEVGARDPAVQQHHRRPVSARVAQEQLTATRRQQGPRRRHLERRLRWPGWCAHDAGCY